MKILLICFCSFLIFAEDTIINNTKYVEKIILKPVYKTKKVIVENKKTNAISFLALYGKFGYQLTDELVREQYQPDFGMMYQKDIDQFRFTAGGTLKGTGFIGVGLLFD